MILETQDWAQESFCISEELPTDFSPETGD